MVLYLHYETILHKEAHLRIRCQNKSLGNQPEDFLLLADAAFQPTTPACLAP